MGGYSAHYKSSINDYQLCLKGEYNFYTLPSKDELLKGDKNYPDKDFSFMSPYCAYARTKVFDNCMKEYFGDSNEWKNYEGQQFCSCMKNSGNQTKEEAYNIMKPLKHYLIK